ncbi:MAG TPA: ankyrin repeat domain-containing protein [Gemmatimonadales bacterium]|nr:ankyrin repeat domain-containing protein [Gemmatimonadales bacterium]
MRTAFLTEAMWHGTLAAAEAILAEHPGLRTADIHTAAVLGDDALVRQFIARDPTSVTAKSPPYGGDALNYLGLSKYLRLDPSRSEAFLRAARALLDAGADPNTGFWTTGKFPEYESALYGAAGVAHHAALTRLLIERGANPNDDDAVYHAPEGDDLGAMQVLVETGKVTPENLSLMLIRKHDWHDPEGVKYLLAHGADPNLKRPRGWYPLNHALARNNSLEIIEQLLEAHADPTLRDDGASAVELAARRGRGDVLAAFVKRGVALELVGVDRLIAACTMGDAAGVREVTQREPQLVSELLAQGSTLLAEFTSTWNTIGVGQLLDLGVPVTARYKGDGYFDIAPESTALHVAAWQIRADLVQLLLERGAPVNDRDGKGRTPLMLAVKACVDSYWQHRRTPEPARLLLAAGATTDGVAFPSGYADVDALLGPQYR